MSVGERRSSPINRSCETRLTTRPLPLPTSTSRLAIRSTPGRPWPCTTEAAIALQSSLLGVRSILRRAGLMPSIVDPQERSLPAPASTGSPEKPPRARARPMPRGFLARVLPRLGIAVLLIGGLHYYIGSRGVSRGGLPGSGAFFSLSIFLLLSW